MRHMRIPRHLCVGALIAAFPLAAFATPGAPEDGNGEVVAALKRAYIACEENALAGRLDGASIAACSVTYEELKRVGFDGSFRALRAWYETRRSLVLTPVSVEVRP